MVPPMRRTTRLDAVVWYALLLLVGLVLVSRRAHAQPWVDGCPLHLVEPTGAFNDWWRQNCCVWYNRQQPTTTACRPGDHGFGRTCNLRPSWRTSLLARHGLLHVGPAPDQHITGYDWLPPALGTWVVTREMYVQGVLLATFGWQQQVVRVCEQPPLFVDGFETGDTSRWSRTVPDPAVFIYSDGFEAGDTSRWARTVP